MEGESGWRAWWGQAVRSTSGCRRRAACLPSFKGGTLMPAKKTTILVVDDDLQLLKIVEHNLVAEGYQVLTAREGKHALESIERNSPDLVLLDIMLPRMDGFQVCQRVREFSAVPIIMITARGQSQDKIKGLDLGADDYLTKPFRVDELLARVRAVLRRGPVKPDHHIPAPRPVGTFRGLRVDNPPHPGPKNQRGGNLTPT